ncbi:hypothetical protein GCM10023149_43250 [Mucilaginibacter gynuensis]|uniref:Carboxypeptidase-like protein n=1 Tax=Mucilaginibacter gynuensis TaxID=1302236 RepID=A0ABP8H780_9SPHI
MKNLIRQLPFILLIFVSFNVLAQESYSISGTVIDEKREPMPGVTIFISGSQQITATDKDGRFTFSGMKAGNYSLSVKMLGYSAPSQTVVIHDKSVDISFALEVKSIVLNEVKIGANKNRERYYAIFKDQFLGTSDNARNCVILNPEIINFNGQKIAGDNIILKAGADDFLIIENEQLGYRIKYLLKTFEYNSVKQLTYYDGDNSFEELEGTDKQKKTWAQNRLTAYNGSMMHFLRSVFANTVADEGFIASKMYKSSNLYDQKVYTDPNPVKFDDAVTVIDSSFISLKIKALNIIYNPKKAARLKDDEIKEQQKPTDTQAEASTNETDFVTLNQSKKDSQLRLYLKEAIIDARGSVPAGTFLIRGEWATKRIGDQLPFEYAPPKPID